MRTRLLTSVFLTVFGALGFAQGEHVRGTVREVRPRQIMVQTVLRHVEVIKLDDKTRFVKSGPRATVSDLKVGQRVVVHVVQETHVADSVTVDDRRRDSTAEPSQRSEPVASSGR